MIEHFRNAARFFSSVSPGPALALTYPQAFADSVVFAASSQGAGLKLMGSPKCFEVHAANT